MCSEGKDTREPALAEEEDEDNDWIVTEHSNEQSAAYAEAQNLQAPANVSQEATGQLTGTHKDESSTEGTQAGQHDGSTSVKTCNTSAGGRSHHVKTPRTMVTIRKWQQQILGSVDPIEATLCCLAKVSEHTKIYREYIQKQADLKEPLYNWTSYERYEAIRLAVKELDKTAAKLGRYRRSSSDIIVALSQAMEHSASISRAIADILAILNARVELYVLELDDCPLSQETQARANAVVIATVQKLSEDSAIVAERVWAAVDLLQGVKERADRETSVGKSWMWFFIAIIVTVLVSTSIAMSTLHLNKPMSLDVHTQVVQLVERAHAVANLTTQFSTSRLQDLDQRVNTISSLVLSQSLRLDNIAESLGPPNEYGLYYDIKPKTKAANKDEPLSMQSQKQMQRLKEDVEGLRKMVNRMDIRLTRRLDKVYKE